MTEKFPVIVRNELQHHPYESIADTDDGVCCIHGGRFTTTPWRRCTDTGGRRSMVQTRGGGNEGRTDTFHSQMPREAVMTQTLYVSISA